jgi:hypothetical protein
VPIEVLYSKPGKPCVVSFGRETPGITCEFIIATAAEPGSAQASGVPIQPNSQTRARSVQREEDETNNEEDAGVGWGVEGAMSPARTAKTRDEEDEDLYGERMGEEEDEEVPPTQQERYQGIFGN